MSTNPDLFTKAFNDFVHNNNIKEFNEPYIKNFRQKLGRFLGQQKIKDNTELKEILLELLSDFKYYSKSATEEIFIDFYNQIREEFKLDERYTIYTHIPSEKDLSRGNSSIFFLNKFFDVNYIESKRNIDITSLYLQGLRDKVKDPTSSPKSYRKLNHVENIICIDDFSGSGKTIKEFLKKSAEIIKEKKVLIFLIHITSTAEKTINAAFETYGYKDYQLLYHNKENDIFSPTSKHISKKGLLKVFEEKELLSDKPLGFNESAALVTFFRNCPNNTLSSYWWKSNEWNPLFPRKDDVLDLLGEEKKQAFVSNAKYNLGKLVPSQCSSDYEIKDILYLMYFKDFSNVAEKFELKRLLGYNDEQLLEHRTSLISKQLLEEDNTLSFKAYSILNELGLFTIKLSALSEESELEIAEDALEITDVYIP